MILDKPRGRLLWTDTSTNQLVIYSIASQTIVQTVATIDEPAGLCLTPDGSKILVALFNSYKLNVYDASTLTLLQQATTPSATPGFTTNPLFIAAVSGNKAFLLQDMYGSGPMAVFEYDIDTNTFKERKEAAFYYNLGQGVPEEAASSDGSTAFVAASVWNSATDTFSPAHNSAYNSPHAISADGKALAEFLAVFGQDGTLNNVVYLPYQIYYELLFNTIPGQKLNATGSLDYITEPDRIRIADVRHGTLIKTIMIPDQLNYEAYDGLVVDPDGQTLYVLTNTGVTTLTFASDPLSIGEVQVSGEEITVLGSGFGPGATLQIDGVPVSAMITDSQHMSATLPNLSAAGHNITVTLPSGASYSLDNALQPLPEASIASSQSGSAPDCTAQTQVVSPAKAVSPAAWAGVSTKRHARHRVLAPVEKASSHQP